MNVIDTRAPRLPVRVWRWIRNTLSDFRSGFAGHLQDECAELWRRRR